MSQRLRHLTTLEHLPRESIERLLDRAETMREGCAHGTRKLDLLGGRTILNLFFEPSTRTRTSFELAARRLGADVINFDISFSSTSKGEALFDTLHTLEAMHLDAIVVRHKVSGTPEELVRHAMSGVSVINAGDGNRAASDAGAARRADHPPASPGFQQAHRGDLRRCEAFARGPLGRARADRTRREGNPPVLAAGTDAFAGRISAVRDHR